MKSLSPVPWVVGLLVLLACEPNDPCDEGYFEQRGFCYPEMSSQDAAVNDGSTGDAGSSGDAAASCDSSDPYAGLGNSCSTQADCPCPTNVCNTAFGYCSRLGCLEDATICPDDWSCLDVSNFDPEAGSICVAPD